MIVLEKGHIWKSLKKSKTMDEIKERWAVVRSALPKHIQDLSHLQVANLLDISTSLLHQYYRGDSLPTSKKWIVLNEKLGISPNFVLLGQGEPFTHYPVEIQGDISVFGVDNTGQLIAARDAFFSGFMGVNALVIPSVAIKDFKPSNLFFIVQSGVCKMVTKTELPTGCIVQRWKDQNHE